MADRGPVKIREGSINDLISIYESAYATIIKEIVGASEAGRIQRARVMARVRAELNSLGVDVDAWVKKEIPQYYLDGTNTALQDLRALGVDISKSNQFAVINTEAIKALTDETALNFALGITAIQKNAQRILDDAFKKQLNFIIAEGRLLGSTRKEISRDLKARINDEGISSLTDRAGRGWTFDTYTRMLARTKAVEARNQGLTNRMLASGYDLVQVTNHRTNHPACAAWEGKILSLTGKTPTGIELPGGYVVAGTLDEAKAAGLFHPNCEHAVNVINPELAAKTEAYDNAFNKR